MKRVEMVPQVIDKLALLKLSSETLKSIRQRFQQLASNSEHREKLPIQSIYSTDRLYLRHDNLVFVFIEDEILISILDIVELN